ncbi:MAG: cupin domain-containing protein [Chloroflexi bacterium]|nr:cupin domain-containing protein [Chloroflexota bacterium]
MTFQVRRIVTGHNEDGKAIAIIDDMVQGEPRRPGADAALIWTSMGFPSNNDGSEDEGKREGVATTLPGGTVFRLLALEPGNSPRMHRTDSLDYSVVLQGEIDMELDDGVIVHCNQGDVIVQRGTVHNWLNRGTETCVIAFVLMDAKPVEVGGQRLDAVG